MWSGCCLPVAVVLQAYPGNAEICPGFPPPQAALRIIVSNEGDVVCIDIFVRLFMIYLDMTTILLTG